MRSLRVSLSWIFAFSGLICLLIVVRYVRWIFLHPPHPQSETRVLPGLVVPLVFSILTAIYAMSWWTTLREKRSERGWGLAASLSYIVLGFLPVIVHHLINNARVRQMPERPLLVALGIGVAGIVAFGRRIDRTDAARPPKPTPIPGDGTSKIANALVGLFTFAGSYGVFVWWSYWRHLKGIPRMNLGFVAGFLILTLIGLAIALLHELGHTLAGTALGMKLRAFIVGPFQIVLTEGRWKFHFDLKKIFSSGGATGMVPMTADFPAASYARMVAAGAVVNLATGLVAIWVAFAMPSGAPVQARGLLALFGAFSLLAGAVNLIPFATAGSYSDGAKIFQLLNGGAWGDFHRALSFAGAGLVTPLRPRNFDIGTIERAATGIGRGREGLLLRLFAHTCHLDRSEMDAAAYWLKDAARIYEESASDIPAELLTVFVFGYACVVRDAAEARKWWDRMEAKKPTRFNVDYWRAKSALDWIEGNLKEANEAWQKAAAAALKLPRAGAYEFDRDLCGVLLYEIDASAAGQQSALVAVGAME